LAIIPYRINRRTQLRRILWEHFELVILGVMFSLLIVTNMFWIAVFLPYGVVTWFVTAQILYWWASPRWNARFPRITKSMLRGEISKLNRLLIRKNEIIKGYFKAIEWHQEEFKRLRLEIENLKEELAEIEEARTLVEELPESFLEEELLEL